MTISESIKEGCFVGCPPYAHDKLLGKRSGKLNPIDDFDFQSLGYTWYHVTKRYSGGTLIGQSALVKNSLRIGEW